MSNETILLYKYVPVDDYLEDILRNQRLYLNDGSNLNDPFELTIFNRTENKLISEDCLHILCLTNSYRNKLMWSHYADSHKGVCLTIRVPKELVYPICYTSKRVYDNSDLNDILVLKNQKIKKNLIVDYSQLSKDKQIAFIKDKKWSYEREYRITFNSTDTCNLIQKKEENWYLKVEIEKIYLGANFLKNKKSYQSKIIEICEQNGITIKPMKLSNINYSVEVQK